MQFRHTRCDVRARPGPNHQKIQRARCWPPWATGRGATRVRARARARHAQDPTGAARDDRFAQPRVSRGLKELRLLGLVSAPPAPRRPWELARTEGEPRPPPGGRPAGRPPGVRACALRATSRARERHATRRGNRHGRADRSPWARIRDPRFNGYATTAGPGCSPTARASSRWAWRKPASANTNDTVAIGPSAAVEPGACSRHAGPREVLGDHDLEARRRPNGKPSARVALGKPPRRDVVDTRRHARASGAIASMLSASSLSTQQSHGGKAGRGSRARDLGIAERRRRSGGYRLRLLGAPRSSSMKRNRPARRGTRSSAKRALLVIAPALTKSTSPMSIRSGSRSGATPIRTGCGAPRRDCPRRGETVLVSDREYGEPKRLGGDRHGAEEAAERLGGVPGYASARYRAPPRQSSRPRRPAETVPVPRVRRVAEHDGYVG